MWTRTNAEAMKVLGTGEVTEVSLDHDMGLHDLDPDTEGAEFLFGDSPEGNGYDLVKWMIENGYVPGQITVHSLNSGPARRMALLFNDYGYDVTISPYQPRR